jgi:hypothetical protein
MRTLAAEKVAIVCEIRVRNSVCVWIQKERERWMFSPPRPVTVVFFSPLSTPPPQDFSLFFWKRFLVVFATCSTTSQPEKDPPKQTQKREKSTHFVECRVTLPWKVV